MRRNGIVHAQLAQALTALRHTDLFVISDAGLPVPPSVPVIDLGIAYGLPEFLPVLALIRDEVEIEAAWAAVEVRTVNPVVHDAFSPLRPELIEHEEFKRRVADCRFVVRTGEATRYANVLLRAGVPW